jgi:hypothetical protein
MPCLNRFAGLDLEGAVLGEHKVETVTLHQGLVAGTLWCTGVGHDPCRAPCGMVGPAEAI